MINSLQWIRAFFSLFVLAYHTTAFMALFGDKDAFYEGWMEALSRIHFAVDMFLILSGIIMVAIMKSYVDRTTGKGKPIKFLWKRIERIYPPLWLYTSIALIGMYVTGAITNFTVGDMIKSMLLIPIDQPFPLVVAWSLVLEVNFYLVFGFSLLFARRFWLQVTVLILGLLIPALIGSFFDDLYQSYVFYFNPLYAEFLSGILLGFLFLNKEIRQKYLSNWLIGLLIIGISALVYAYFNYIEPVPKNGSVWPIDGKVRLLIYGLPSFIFIFGLMMFEERFGNIAPKWFMTLGASSYSLYLSHLLTFHFVGIVWGVLGLQQYFGNIGLIFALMTTAVAWAMISFKFVEQTMVDVATNRVKLIFNKMKEQPQ